MLTGWWEARERRKEEELRRQIREENERRCAAFQEEILALQKKSCLEEANLLLNQILVRQDASHRSLAERIGQVEDTLAGTKEDLDQQARRIFTKPSTGGPLADWEIRRLAANVGMIVPFAEGSVTPGVISYGLSSYGYDLRLGRRFKIFTNINNSFIDPKRVDPRSYVEVETDEPLLIPPMSYVLGESIERFDIPRDVVVIVLGKSTFARAAILVNVTPGEPEWEGVWTIEISNPTMLPARIYPNEGIAQAIFFRTGSPRPCEISYRDKRGKYQGQTGVQTAIVPGA